jgi:hypothetical protein
VAQEAPAEKLAVAVAGVAGVAGRVAVEGVAGVEGIVERLTFVVVGISFMEAICRTGSDDFTAEISLK